MNAVLTRRAALRGIASLPASGGAAAAFALSAAPDVVDQAPRVPAGSAENAELLRLGQQIAPLLAAYHDAVDRYIKARAIAEASVPPVPDEIVVSGNEWLGLCEREKDVDGNDVWPPEAVGADGRAVHHPPRRLIDSVATRAAIKRGNLRCDGRTRRGRRIQQLVGIAERYEAKREAAINASGLNEVTGECYWAAADLKRLAFEVREIEPSTMAGILIHARALCAYAEAEQELGGCKGEAGTVLGLRVAEALLRASDASG